MLKTLRFLIAATMGVRLGSDYEKDRVVIGVVAGDDERLLRGAMKAAKEGGFEVERIAAGGAAERTFRGIVTPVELTPEQVRAGSRIAARRMGELLGGKGKAGAIGEVANAGEALRGFLEEMKKFPGIELVSGQVGAPDPAEAAAVTRKMIAEHPDLTMLYAARAGIAMGAARALEQDENRSLKLIGFGWTQALRDACLAGWIDSLVAADSFQAGYAAAKAIAQSGRPGGIEVVARLFSREDMQA